MHGVVDSSNENLIGAIDEAALYGATPVLHVIRPNPEGSFMEDYQRTQAIIWRAIPYAEKKRIYILGENVWSTSPVERLRWLGTSMSSTAPTSRPISTWEMWSAEVGLSTGSRSLPNES